ncbi:MAG: hypothetical protein LBE80_11200 [Deltaproteobacteria bacterium]|jgi:hypothetical protein|nr:hypothetical protein [Deltaproteobacteria bacterium]
MTKKNDLELWRKTARICDECLELDRAMLAKLGPLDQDKKADPENYLDPKLWEQFISARNDLVDFTTSSIQVLTASAKASARTDSAGLSKLDEKDFAEQSELENRLVTSLKEMVELENKLTNYLSENLNLLKETIDGLNKNQTLFIHYSKKFNKPEPGYLNVEY